LKGLQRSRQFFGVELASGTFGVAGELG